MNAILKKPLLTSLIALTLASLLVKLQYMYIMPVVNDEAFYLYDAFNIQNGLIPYVDFFGKAPIYVYLLAAWNGLWGDSFFAGRILTILFSCISGFLIYRLVTRWHKGIALISFAIFMTDAFVLSRHVQAMTNPFFIMLYLASLYMYIRYREKPSHLMFFATSILIFISFLTRQVMVFIFPAMFLWEFLHEDPRRSFLGKGIAAIKTPFLMGILVVALTATTYAATYILINPYQADKLIGISVVQLSQAQRATFSFSDAFIRKALQIYQPFSGVTLRSPLIYFGIVLAGMVATAHKDSRIRGLLQFVIAGIGVLIAGNTYYIFSSKYFSSWFSYIFVIFISALVTFLWLIYTERKTFVNKFTQAELRPVTFAAINGLSLLLLYFMYSRFETLIEIYPFLIIIAASGIYWLLRHSHKPLTLLLSLFVILTVLSHFYQFTFKNFVGIGSHWVPEFLETVHIIENETSSDEVIFTGFPAFSSSAQRHNLLDITHPSWYGYEHVSESYRDQFLPPISSVIEALHAQKPPFVIIGRYTYGTFFVRYPEITEFVENNYTLRKRYSTFDLLERNDTQTRDTSPPSYEVRTDY